MTFRFGLLFLIATTLLLLIVPLGKADSRCHFADETVLIGGVVPLIGAGLGGRRHRHEMGIRTSRWPISTPTAASK